MVCSICKEESDVSTFVKPKRRDVCIASFFYLLNVFDMIATVYAINKGYAIEGNPLMRFLMDQGMWMFIAFKLVVVAGFAAFLLFLPISKSVNTVLLFLAGVYTMLGISHVLIYLGAYGR